MSKKDDDTTPLEKLIGAAIVLVIVFFVYRCKWSDNDNDSKYDKKIAKTEQTVKHTESFVGTYITKGWYGSVKLTINNDGKVIAKSTVTSTYKDEHTGKVHQGTRERTFYGVWKKMNGGVAQLEFTKPPYIFLDNSRFCYIKNGYIYESNIAIEANDPNKRFKLTRQ